MSEILAVIIAAADLVFFSVAILGVSNNKESVTYISLRWQA
jgi:hypothetical protein